MKFKLNQSTLRKLTSPSWMFSGTAPISGELSCCGPCNPAQTQTGTGPYLRCACNESEKYAILAIDSI